jgi:predicted XRE-type DNA-binding protein
MDIEGEGTMTDKMEIQTFDSVWDAIEDTPQEAANMRLRSELMIAVEQEVRSWALTQAKASERLGVTQPRLNDLLRGKIDKFSLDALVELSARAGLAVKLGIEKAA